eukprot:4451804-Pyramimonas_sp.AAC.1
MRVRYLRSWIRVRYPRPGDPQWVPGSPHGPRSESTRSRAGDTYVDGGAASRDWPSTRRSRPTSQCN